MQTITWEGYKAIKETVQELLGQQDPILFEFDVMPLDYSIKDVLSPKVFLSKYRFVLVVDDLIEVYNIGEIWISFLGGEPKFTLIQQFFEFRPNIESKDTPISKNVDFPDDWIRFSIMEKGSHPKEFVLRKEKTTVKGYQTWAFAQIIKNLQKNYDDYKLEKMIHGDFSFFDPSFLVLATLVFFGYVLLSVLLGEILPNFLRIILDGLFALVCIVVLLWVFWTIFVNIRKYRKVYEKYKPRQVLPSTPLK